MSKPDKDNDASKPKSGKLKFVVGALALLGLGGGGVFGAMHLGYVGSPAGAAEVNKPKLLAKGEEDQYALDPKADDTSGFVDGEGGSEYRTSYYSFEEGFTANLKNSAGLVQLSLAASTKHDGRVLQWLKRHELAVRSAIMVELANTPEDDAYTVAGKERLQKRLTDAMNQVLTDKEGFGGVDQVYFRTFLVQ